MLDYFLDVDGTGCGLGVASGEVVSGVGVRDLSFSSFFSIFRILFNLVCSRVIASPLWRSRILLLVTPNFFATAWIALGWYGVGFFFVRFASNFCHAM